MPSRLVPEDLPRLARNFSCISDSKLTFWRKKLEKASLGWFGLVIGEQRLDALTLFNKEGNQILYLFAGCAPDDTILHE